MDIENSPQYQEYIVKVRQAQSLRESLSTMENKTIPELREGMVSFCISSGHDYGAEKESKEWISNMVNPYTPNVPTTYNQPSEDRGHNKRVFIKKCRFCGDAVKRDAVVTYS